VNQHKGKVVVVDCWWLDCAPCLREMPRLQAMQTKYGKDGFVGITACIKLDETVDNDENPADGAQALAERKMTGTTNVLLDEGIAVWQKNLRFASVPHVFVFDRAGKWRDYGDKDVDYDKIEQKVVELLNKGKWSRRCQTGEAEELGQALGRVPSGLFVLTARRGDLETACSPAGCSRCRSSRCSCRWR